MALRSSVSILAATLSLPALAQTSPYDFSELTQLAAGALVGQNVQTPVPGFDLLIIRDGRTVYHRSFGNWAIDRVANADSASKTISGALLMTLTDDAGPGGPAVVSLDTRLSHFIPDFDGAMQTATLRQCFAHTAGFGSSPAVGDPQLTLQQAALEIAAGPLPFGPPGSIFAYGGTSMHAAGAVAEVAAGQPWNTLFAQRLADPLGLVATRYVLSSPDNPRIAGGCESSASEFGRVMEVLRRYGLAPGGTRLLSASACRELFTRQTPVGIPINNSPLDGSSDYGVGVWLDRRGAGGVLQGALAAGARGFSSWVDFDDGMVGVFATDISSSANVVPLVGLLRDAAERAVRASPCSQTDRTADGRRTPLDIFVQLNAYFAPEPRGDFNGDGVHTPTDLFAYLTAYFAGC